MYKASGESLGFHFLHPSNEVTVHISPLQDYNELEDEAQKSLSDVDTLTNNSFDTQAKRSSSLKRCSLEN